MNILVLLLTAAGLLLAGSKGSRSAKPIDYVVTTKASVMTIALNGDVTWNEAVNGNSFTITVAGEASDFIVKRMNYSFRDGAIKTFAMAPLHPDTQRIVITLRKDQAYRIYQSPSSGRLNIEFFTGSAIAAAPVKSPVKDPVKVTERTEAKLRQKQRRNEPAVKTAPIDIATIAKEQTSAAVKTESVTAEAVPKSVTTETTPAVSSMNTSAILLLFASMFIITGGGVAVAYVLVKRKSTEVAPAAPVAEPSVPTVMTVVPAEYSSVSREQAKEKEEEEFRQAIEYAEQYLRSQGEFELQQRLERLNSSSMQKKLERASNVQGKGTNNAAAAEKLGISVGEMELASRLQKFQEHHMTENV